ncbi:hypothetical protein TNIN_300391 [Trichonephila inaurata madagascariensis]|uniref:Uncharacterized protein n=1 Tax=Trichonephila inaurata madagascariensis TaxID=2747483 RepID=A0A8X7CLU4_9ARAC|nr:hypothetical protein TNIN_300391 [Trichonephila inaurata madagascariensis]
MPPNVNRHERPLSSAVSREVPCPAPTVPSPPSLSESSNVICPASLPRAFQFACRCACYASSPDVKSPSALAQRRCNAHLLAAADVQACENLRYVYGVGRSKAVRFAKP